MKNRKVAITGAGGVTSAYVIAQIIKEGGQALIIVPGRVRSERLAEDLSFFCDELFSDDQDESKADELKSEINNRIEVLPPDEEVFLKYEAKNQDQMIERARIIKRLRSEKNLIVIAPASAAVKRMPDLKEYEDSKIKIKIGEEIPMDNLKEKLTKLGYDRTDTVYGQGQYSVRGGIIDIFPPDSDTPYRIEFFGDEIDSLRAFDIDSQRSIESTKEIELYPVNEGTSKGHEIGSSYNYVFDYLIDGKIIIEDPERIKESLELRYQELWNDLEYMVEKGQADKSEAERITSFDDLKKAYEKEEVYFLEPFTAKITGVDNLDELRNINVQPAPSYNGHMELLTKDLKNYIKKGYRVIISASSDSRLETLRNFVEEEISEEQLARDNNNSYVQVKKGFLSSGIIFPEEDLCYISDGNIFDTTKSARRRRNRKYQSKGKAINAFTELVKGEYVVHDNHGIGVFEGIEELNDQGIIRDYIKIKYQGHGILYVPVEQMDVVQKYIGSEGKAPRINKLGSDEWRRTKERARKAVEDMTDELIELYAKRKAESGYAFSEDTVWQAEFESAFPFEETPDQLRSIDEIKVDMEKEEPMDRLLCGDVGYGKTEVAARAIFKCLIEGKQAAMLVPTTILASQHYDTLTERLKGFPFTVELMSRFRSDKELNETAKKLKSGKVDLVIGTHRLLSSDIEFKDLGLLVIDEEQRFGVKHKEKIKTLKAGIDVLTLSATPIPRTLNMSLTGIRDMSLISEPPEERYPVQTYVMEQDDDLIREVITRELDRSGQIFVVYNRVRGIVRIADRIKELVPEAKVAVGHGQMNESALEEVMREFVSGESDVLVATTIVESGLDIPNANTLIVLDADKCGLAQLYQLRGRVGRSNRIAYAYLMYQKDKVLTELAEKRLRAVREFTEFGAGFKIAMRDMELRGAGNVLGAEQSGHMMDVGYELYARLVDEAARRARGEIIPEKREDFAVEIKANANIPSWYIEDESVKLAMYKRIADIETKADSEDVIDELIDRFGEIPKETLNLIMISRIRTLAERSNLSRIHEQNGKIYLTLPNEESISPYSVMMLSQEFGRDMLFHGGREPYFVLSYDKKTKLDQVVRALDILLDDSKPEAA